MASYIATAIRQARSESRISWAIETRCSPVIDQKKLVNRIVDFPRDDWESRRWSPKTWREQMATFARLREERYDFGIDLQGYAKTALCLRIARPKRRAGAFAKDGFSRLLNPPIPGDPDAKHRVERMMDALNSLGDFPKVERPIMPTPNPVPPVVSISTGAGALNKRYPSDKWARIAEALVRDGYRVAFLGAGKDPRVEVEGAQDLVGKLDLFETMSVVAGSVAHLAADTGTGHMAAAYGVPFVSIFGPMAPELYRPYSTNGIVLKRGERPDAVEVEEVLAAFRNLSVDHGRAVSH